MHESDYDIDELLARLVEQGGSDLFVTTDAPVSMKQDGRMAALGEHPLSPQQSSALVRSLMTEDQATRFEHDHESQFAVVRQAGRFRVSAFVQKDQVGAVLREIKTDIPTLDQLNLPDTLSDIVMGKRGLVVFTGATGSGKSSSLAALVGHRNAHSAGHIITIEDPIEFVHSHRGCLVTQREVGTDTPSWDEALKNTLRQAPDVILIGEIRNRATMEYALHFAETGHLVLSTLHANNANQAIDRMLNFFDQSGHAQVLMDLSLNLRAIVSQRLVPMPAGGRIAALEVLRASPRVADLIFKGQISEIKQAMTKSTGQGMITFDSYLFDLYERGMITYEQALKNADSLNDLRLRIKLESHNAPVHDLDTPSEHTLGITPLRGQ